MFSNPLLVKEKFLNQHFQNKKIFSSRIFNLKGHGHTNKLDNIDNKKAKKKKKCFKCFHQKQVMNTEIKYMNCIRVKNPNILCTTGMLCSSNKIIVMNVSDFKELINHFLYK